MAYEAYSNADSEEQTAKNSKTTSGMRKQGENLHPVSGQSMRPIKTMCARHGQKDPRSTRTYARANVGIHLQRSGMQTHGEDGLLGRRY